MDNQHKLERELVYLAAIIDGEGSITLVRTGNKRLCGIAGLSPRITVTNTNEAIIQYVINIYHDLLGINPHVKTQAAGKYRRTKTCYWVDISGLTKCKKVLEAIRPYLIGKLAQADLLLEFIKLRGEPQRAKTIPYGPQELQILEKIRALNFRGLSETEYHEQLHAA